MLFSDDHLTKVCKIITLISINEWNYLCPSYGYNNVLHVMIKVLEMDINFRNENFDYPM